jgi:hypothetical protein
MQAGLIVILVLVAWLLGPFVLRWVGGFFALAALVLAATGGRNLNQMSLLIGGIAGVLMWLVGMAWQSGREEGRGPLVWSLLVNHIPALRERRYRRQLHYADYWNQPAFDSERSVEHAQPHPDREARVRRWRSPFRRRTRYAEEPVGATNDGRRTNRDRQSPRNRSADGAVIDGTAHDVSATSADDEASRTQSLREDVDRTLEEARDYLEPIAYELFVETGAGWLDRLNVARRSRRNDLPPIQGGSDVLHDRRVLFSVIAYDWTLIGNAFMRDPSSAGRTLCAIANRYAHEGPRESDPAAARRAFGEICAALRPQSVNRVLNPTKPWVW